MYDITELEYIFTTTIFRDNKDIEVDVTWTYEPEEKSTGNSEKVFANNTVYDSNSNIYKLSNSEIMIIEDKILEQIHRSK